MRPNPCRPSSALSVLALLAALLTVLVAPAARAQQAPLIAAVSVEGNEYISRDAILDVVKEVLKIGEPYTEEAATKAKDAVTALGYFEEVTLAREVVEGGINVVISVVEKKRIEKIVFVGNTVADDKALGEVILSKVGHVIDYNFLRRDAERIEGYYQKRGYQGRVLRANVDEFGVLTFVIEEAHVESFVIEGLKKTEESIIRRLIKTQPGALYNVESVQKDMQRIFALGIFENIKIDLRAGETDPTAVVVVLKLTEKRTGTLSVAAAYSELDRFVFGLSVSENNFRGRAERLAVDLEAFGRTSYDLRFFEPFLDDHDTTLDFSIFDTERRRRFGVAADLGLDDDRFEERRTGATMRLTRPLPAANQRLGLKLRTESVSGSSLQAARSLDGWVSPLSASTPPGGSDSPVTIYAPLHRGGRVNSVGLEWTWDTRDMPYDPHKGMMRQVTLEQAGTFLGGDNDFALLSAEQRFYLPMRDKQDVLATRIMLATSTGNVPMFESWFVGGSTTLRGFRQDRFRGESMALVNVEYRYRVSDSLSAVAFVDAGDAFGGNFDTALPGFSLPAENQDFALHIGYGLGIRALTPLGPIRIDYGMSDEGSEIHFGFGQVF